MKDSLGKNLGIAAVCVFGWGVASMAVLTNSQWFSSVFLLTAVLNTVILYWPAHASGAIKHPPIRVLIVLVAIGMTTLNIVFYYTVSQYTSAIKLFLWENAGIITIVGFNLLVLLFILMHYFLFRFFRVWLPSLKAHIAGFSGFLAAAYLFFFWQAGSSAGKE